MELSSASSSRLQSARTVSRGVITAPVLILFMHVTPRRGGYCAGVQCRREDASGSHADLSQIGGLSGAGLLAFFRRPSGDGLPIFICWRYQRRHAGNSLRCFGIHCGDHGGRQSVPFVDGSCTKRWSRFIALGFLLSRRQFRSGGGICRCRARCYRSLGSPWL